MPGAEVPREVGGDGVPAQEALVKNVSSYNLSTFTWPLAKCLALLGESLVSPFFHPFFTFRDGRPTRRPALLQGVSSMSTRLSPPGGLWLHHVRRPLAGQRNIRRYGSLPGIWCAKGSVQPTCYSLPVAEGLRVVHLLAVAVLSRAGFNVAIMKCNFPHLGASLVVTMAVLAGEVSGASSLESTDLDFNTDLLSSAVSVMYPDLALALGEVERDL